MSCSYLSYVEHLDCLVFERCFTNTLEVHCLPHSLDTDWCFFLLLFCTMAPLVGRSIILTSLLQGKPGAANGKDVCLCNSISKFSKKTVGNKGKQWFGLHHPPPEMNVSLCTQLFWPMLQLQYDYRYQREWFILTSCSFSLNSVVKRFI